MSNAFPRAGHEYDQMDWVPAPAQDGMTLRDYMATKLMATYLSDTAVKWDTENLERAADSAVRAAEALLERLDE